MEYQLVSKYLFHRKLDFGILMGGWCASLDVFSERFSVIKIEVVLCELTASI